MLIAPIEVNSLNLERLDTVNLTNCDREPIHIPNYIQPQGLLMVLDESDLHITQISENAGEVLGIELSDLLRRPLADFIGSDHIKVIREGIVRELLNSSFENINPLNLSFIAGDRTTTSFNGIIHRAPSGEIVLELEALEPTAESDFFQFYRQIKVTLAKMQTAQNLAALCDLVVHQVREITGFDRVMIYRFNEQGDGTVIAESKKNNLGAFLGMHFPDSDIPQQAKKLYTLNWLRLISDVNYRPTPLVSLRNKKSDHSLDMSYCGLRAVSPLHVEYLKNMGVVASMSVSLIQQQNLWGLISCHHHTPKLVPYEIRTVCEFLGQLMSTELANKETNENLDYKLHLKTIQGQFVERLTKATNFISEITADQESLLRLTGASGAAVCDADNFILIGETPKQEDIKPLIAWLLTRFEQDIFVTDTLPVVYPRAEAYKNVASGLLAMAVSKVQHQYVLWFRPELLQTLTWAGNPDKPTRIEEDGSLTIFPRQSFSAWQEIVRGKSNGWLLYEVEGAIELRRAIIDIVLRQAGELANINLELERINSELDAFAYIASHDLKEPLRGIHNYASFLIDDYAEILKGEGAEKLHTLLRLTTRMELLIDSLQKFSRLGRQELLMDSVDLNSLLRNVTELFDMDQQWANCHIRIPKSLPVVLGDRVLIEEVFINLVSNAFKYNEQDEKWVEVSWLEPTQPPYSILTFYVRDNGIGIRDKHLDSVFRIFKRLHAPQKYGGGTGAGLTIVKKIIERHGGSLHVESIYGEGTTFWFTLPKHNINI